MNITDEEIKAVLVSIDPETKRLPSGFRDFARALLALQLERLAACEMPEPTRTTVTLRGGDEMTLESFTSDQLHAVHAQGVAKGMAVNAAREARLGIRDGLAMALAVVELYGMKGDVIYREIEKLRGPYAAIDAARAKEPDDKWIAGWRKLDENNARAKEQP